MTELQSFEFKNLDNAPKLANLFGHPADMLLGTSRHKFGLDHNDF